MAGRSRRFCGKAFVDGRFQPEALLSGCLLRWSLAVLILVLSIPSGTAAAPGPDAASLSAQAATGPEKLLVGTYIDERPSREVTIYRDDGEYWFPYQIFLGMTGLKEADRTGATARYGTNLGIIAFDTGLLRTFGAERFISFTDLNTVFMAAPMFSQPLFAVLLSRPWRPVSKASPDAHDEIVPDITAPDGSISYLGIQSDSRYDVDDGFEERLDLAGAGRVLNGFWYADAVSGTDEGVDLTHYHWSIFNNRFAARIGTGVSGSSSLLGSIGFTGFQAGWDNRSVVRHLDAEQGMGSDLFLSLDTDQSRTIEGSGPPAGIAELRFDGQPVSRQRIPLDGKFVFDNVRMTSDLRKTEVYVYKNSVNEHPISVLDYSQPVSSRSLPAGERLARAGVGLAGNPLDSNEYDRAGAVGFAQVLYGVNDRVTAECAVQSDPDDGSVELLAGVVASPDAHWTGTLYGAAANGALASDIRMEGRYKHWDTNYWGNFRQDGFGSDGSGESLNHAVRAAIYPYRNLQLQLHARHETVDGSPGRRYVLPGVSWAPFSCLGFLITPDDERDYRYEASFSFADSNRISYTYYDELSTIDYRHEFSDRFDIRLINDYAASSGKSLSNVALNWYPDANRNDLVETAFSFSDRSCGISGAWVRDINAGFRMQLRYSYNMNSVSSLEMGDVVQDVETRDPEKRIELSLNWNLGWSGRAFQPVGRSSVSMTRGGIGGSFDIDRQSGPDPAGLDNIGILLDGRQVQQQKSGGTYFIGRLMPGLYTVSVDQENLPPEYVVDRQEQVVEVMNGAVSKVDFPVHAEYGVSGRVTGIDGKGIADAMVLVEGGGVVTLRSVTDAFGYYRVNGLRRGDYVLSVMSVDGEPAHTTGRREFRIDREYLFDMDLALASPPVNERGKVQPQADGGVR